MCHEQVIPRFSTLGLHQKKKENDAPNHHILCLDKPFMVPHRLNNESRETCAYHFSRSSLQSAVVLQLQAGVTNHVTDGRHNFNPAQQITPKILQHPAL
jgi:hypothetical protein